MQAVEELCSGGCVEPPGACRVAGSAYCDLKPAGAASWTCRSGVIGAGVEVAGARGRADRGTAAGGDGEWALPTPRYDPVEVSVRLTADRADGAVATT
ncbi:hypothetical protein GCM10020220_062950 [Nonomuraea rubra]